MAQAIAKNQTVVYGPFGSQLPENYCMELQECEQIKEVIIRHGFIVDAIGFVISKPCGRVETKIFGGHGGNESRIVLKCGEFITQISGTYGEYQYQHNQCVIGTLKIHTNLCPSGNGPYGKGYGIPCAQSFSAPPLPQGVVVGFFGRCNNYLESIGIVVKEDCPCA